MGKHPKDEDFFDFYLELPLAEYLKDIEIQDEYDGSDESKGLSAEQVSQIAQDSLEACKDSESNPDHQKEDIDK